jgi:hypothetical protein
MKEEFKILGKKKSLEPLENEIKDFLFFVNCVIYKLCSLERPWGILFFMKSCRLMISPGLFVTIYMFVGKWFATYLLIWWGPPTHIH